MSNIIIFFYIMISGLIFSHVFNRLHLPWVVALMLAGVVIGPEGLAVFGADQLPDETFTIFADIGLIFLMFMAGLETKFSSTKELKDGVFWIFLLNSLLPFITGLGIGLFFNFPVTASILLGIVLASSSVAVIVPALEKNNLLKTRIGHSIIGSAIIEDLLGLVLLSILLQTIDPTSEIPLPLLYILLSIFLILLKISIPKMRKLFSFKKQRVDRFEHELRLIFVILFGVVVLFEVIGLHSIIAGFFAGFALSDSIQNQDIKHKLHALSYGIFIPIFFVMIGTKVSIRALSADGALLLTSTIVIGSILAKTISGVLASQLSNFNLKQSIFIGVSMTPQLSTPLAIAVVGREQGLLNDTLTAAIISLAMITTLIGPIAMSLLSTNFTKD